MDSMTYDMEKGIARAYLKKHNFTLGSKYYDKYLEFLNNEIANNPDSDELKEDLKNSLNEYNDLLFAEARDAFNTNKWIKTLIICKKLFENGFDEVSMYKFVSLCYKNLEQNDIRLKYIKKYVELVPHDIESDKLLAEAYFELDKDKYAEKALELYKKYLEKVPNDSFIWNMMGHIYATCIYKDTKQIDKQLECFNKALELKPNEPMIMKNIAQTYVRAKMNDEAEKMYQKILDINKQSFSNDDYFNYAAFRIRCGDFLNGFKYYEHRLKKENKPTFYPNIKQERWDGISTIRDSVLLVHLEQGFGDVILFIRFVKNIKSYAKKVIAVVQHELVELFRESDLGFEVHSVRSDLSKLQFDYHIPLISLPMALRLTPETVTDRQGYLHVHPGRKEKYREVFINQNDKFKIGINLEGAESGKGQGRDVDWKFLEEFQKIENVELYCLNADHSPEFFKKINPDMICLGGTFQNFADTAAAIENMDLVISTDNVILNLAGALGKKTIALLNYDYEYRWYNAESGHVVWYDNVVSLVNDVQNEWEPSVHKAVKLVKEYTEKQA